MMLDLTISYGARMFTKIITFDVSEKVYSRELHAIDLFGVCFQGKTVWTLEHPYVRMRVHVCETQTNSVQMSVNNVK